MSTKMNTQMYEGEGMDHEIEQDVAELRTLLREVPGPTEPHPAYWNNFLIRVHEQIEQNTAPKRRAWWSPALIWGSLTGTVALVVVAFLTGIFPFSGEDSTDQVIAANDPVPAVEQPVGQENDAMIDDELAMLLADVDPVAADETYLANDPSIVLTKSDIDMLEAIESGDDDAILRAIIDDVEI